MTWLTWHQFRTQALVVLGVLVAIAVALALTGPHLVHLYDTTVATCRKDNDCGTAETQFLKTDRFRQQVSVVLLVAPALIGIFWGAPLIARELEAGSYKLGWTQSVTRSPMARLQGRAGRAGVHRRGRRVEPHGHLVVQPLDRVTMSPFSPSSFDRRDLVPVAYAAFAFACAQPNSSGSGPT
jgi:hypothetical protein